MLSALLHDAQQFFSIHDFAILPHAGGHALRQNGQSLRIEANSPDALRDLEHLAHLFHFRFQHAGIFRLVPQSQPHQLAVERVGELETKDATRTRIKWYCGLGLFNEFSAAKLEGIE